MTLIRVSKTRDVTVTHARVDAVRQDYSAQVRASRSQSGWLIALSRMLEECATLLYLQEIDLEVSEVILAEELERGLHPPDGWDLSAELDKACASVDRSIDDCAAEAE
jgi:hypothetical protein